MEPDHATDEGVAVMTLEAFADTIVPGEKRTTEDLAIAGATEGGGAVAAGAVELLRLPEVGLTPALDGLVQSLNGHAQRHADERGLTLDQSAPPFVALEFPERIALVQTLTAPGHPEKEIWVMVAVFSNMAFDSAAHLPTADAIAADHPGLATMGFLRPDPDGLWRFPAYSYGRQLAPLHPDTSPSGSPA